MPKVIFKLVAALLICLLSYQNANALVRGGYSTGVAPPLFTPAWLSLRIGGGGEMNNVTVAPSDGTLVSAANTYGAYIRKNSGSCSGSDNGGWGTTYAAPCWEQLFTQTTAALTLAGVNNEQQGVNEIIACNNNTNDAYAWYNKTLWSTTNLQAAASARLWNPISGVTTSISGNPGLVTWHTIACDPANPSVVYASSPAAGVKSSGNGLVATPTFAAVTGIGTVGVVADIIAFDGTPSAPTQSCTQFTGSPTCTKHIMILVAGTGGFESYTGGASWTATTGGPTAAPTNAGNCESGYCFVLKTDQFGNFYASIGDGKIYKYVPNGTAGGGTWSTLSPVTGNTSGVFDIDPTSSAVGSLRMVAAYASGNISVSTNGGVNWCTASEMPFTASGAQPPWFANANQQQGTGGHNTTYISLKDLAFDGSGNLHASAGIGNWVVASASVTCGATWQADSIGIENLVTNHIDSPPGMGPFAAEWDRAFYAALNPDVFPSHYWPDITYSTTFGAINAGWELDWAGGSPTTLAGYGFFDNDISASSSNGGNTFAAWANLIGTGTTTPGGAVAASTSLNWISSAGDNSTTLRYTLNGATSAWGTSTISGVGTITTFGGLGIPAAADRVTANAFCLYDSNHAVFSSVDGGATWAKRINGGTTNTGFYNHQLKAVPGVAGTFYLSGGNQGGGTTSYQLYKITSTTNECDTATLVNANFTNIYGFGFGAAKPGGANFPTIYYWGYNSGVPGLWEIDNGGTTATLLNVPTSQQTWPSNSGDFVQTVSGDNNVYGRVYVGFHGSGSTYIDKQDACPWVNFSGSIIPNVSLTGTVSLTAQHSGMVPVTQVNYYVDGSLIGSQTTGSGTPTTYTQSWVTGGVATGAHTLKVEAIGNGCVAGGPDSFSIPITTH